MTIAYALLLVLLAAISPSHASEKILLQFFANSKSIGTKDIISGTLLAPIPGWTISVSMHIPMMLKKATDFLRLSLAEMARKKPLQKWHGSHR